MQPSVVTLAHTGLAPHDCDAVQQQTMKTAVESAQMLLRIDDIVSGMSRKDKGPSRPAGGAEVEGDGDNVDAERQLPE